MNYGYGFLEGECRRAINAVGLEPSVGFLHDISNYQTKQSLVYDLEEPFRWLVDLTVLQAFQSRVLGLGTFHFKFDDYRFRLNPEAKERFIALLKEQFNIGVSYRGRRLKWDTVIEEKTSELGRYLTGRSRSIDFSEPAPMPERTDNHSIREKILSLTQSEARSHGIGRSSLHYLRRKAREERPFKVYQNTRKKVEQIISD